MSPAEPSSEFPSQTPGELGEPVTVFSSGDPVEVMGPVPSPAPSPTLVLALDPEPAVVPALSATLSPDDPDDQVPDDQVPEPPPGGWDARAILGDAFLGMEDAGSYRYVMTITADGLGAEFGDADIVDAGIVGVEGEVVAPDRQRALMTVGFGGFSMEIEIIQIGTDLYIRDPLTGLWGRGDDVEDGLYEAVFGPDLLLEDEFLQDLEHEGIDQLPGGLAHRIVARPDLLDLGEGPLDLGGGG